MSVPGRPFQDPSLVRFGRPLYCALGFAIAASSAFAPSCLPAFLAGVAGVAGVAAVPPLAGVAGVAGVAASVDFFSFFSFLSSFFASSARPAVDANTSAKQAASV